MTELDDWVREVCVALDLDPAIVDTGLLLDLAHAAALASALANSRPPPR